MSTPTYTIEQLDQAKAATMRHLADIQQRREAVMQAYGQAMSEIDRDFIRLSAELMAYAEMERRAMDGGNGRKIESMEGG